MFVCYLINTFVFKLSITVVITLMNIFKIVEDIQNVFFLELTYLNNAFYLFKSYIINILKKFSIIKKSIVLLAMNLFYEHPTKVKYYNINILILK